MRKLPPDLVDQLRAARRLENLADNLGRQRDAIAGTSALMLAAVEAGWTRTEIGAVVGMRTQSVAYRVAAARSRLAGARPGLIVDAPLDREPDPVAVLKQPLGERQWLTLHEAAAFAGSSVPTLYNWRRNGLLPNTEHPTPHRYLYLRADLKRVMRAKRYHSLGVDYAALLAEIDAAPV